MGMQKAPRSGTDSSVKGSRATVPSAMGLRRPSAPAAFARVGPDGVTYTFLRFASTTVRPISRTTGVSYNRINIFE